MRLLPSAVQCRSTLVPLSSKKAGARPWELCAKPPGGCADFFGAARNCGVLSGWSQYRRRHAGHDPPSRPESGVPNILSAFAPDLSVLVVAVLSDAGCDSRLCRATHLRWIAHRE